jgi:hypothetical protein
VPSAQVISRAAGTKLTTFAVCRSMPCCRHHSYVCNGDFSPPDWPESTYLLRMVRSYGTRFSRSNIRIRPPKPASRRVCAADAPAAPAPTMTKHLGVACSGPLSWLSCRHAYQNAALHNSCREAAQCVHRGRIQKCIAGPRPTWLRKVPPGRATEHASRCVPRIGLAYRYRDGQY